MSKPTYAELLEALREANEMIDGLLSYAGGTGGFGHFDELIARAEAKPAATQAPGAGHE